MAADACGPRFVRTNDGRMGRPFEIQLRHKKMKRSATRILLSAAAVLSFSSHFASAAATPDTNQFFWPELLDAKMKVGADGNIRLIWDYVAGKGYGGSALWILSPSGNLLAAGSPTIPASVGWGKLTAKGALLNPVSNIMLFAQADGNTTLAWGYGTSEDSPAIGTWTYNSAGALIASSIYGPYGSTVVHEAYFDQLTGKLIVKWRQQLGTNLFTHTVWALDEFGNISQSAGPYGGYLNSQLSKVVLSGTNQIWYWSIPKTGTPDHTLNTWEIDSSGAVINSNSYGPY
jgi:hypothetical protein